MSEVEISVTDGSITSPAPQGASGGLEAIGARASTPRIDPEGRGGLDRYATKHDIRHLEDVIARFGSGVVSELRRLEASINSTSAVLDGRISSVDGRISSLEKIVDVKFTALDGKIASLQKSLDDNMAGLKDLLKSELKGVHRVVYFSIAISAVVVGVVLSVTFRM